MKIVFMGTPEFAVPSLEAVLAMADCQVTGVVTQPDKPKGRGKKLLMPPVKETALANQIAVFQPVKIKDPNFVAALAALRPDIIVVVAYGQILPEPVLNLPPLGCINVHGSLLPRYRGAAPIQWSVIKGEKTTGITTMYMAKGLDTGDMLLKSEVQIEPQDTYGTLHNKLAVVGAGLLTDTIKGLAAGNIHRTPQNEAEATYAPMITKEMGRLDFSLPAAELNCLIRGLNPKPVAYARYQDQPLKIYQAKVLESSEGTTPGQICAVHKKEGFVVQCGEGSLLIQQVQGPSGKMMSAADYMRGHPVKEGEFLL